MDRALLSAGDFRGGDYQRGYPGVLGRRAEKGGRWGGVGAWVQAGRLGRGVRDLAQDLVGGSGFGGQEDNNGKAYLDPIKVMMKRHSLIDTLHHHLIKTKLGMMAKLMYILLPFLYRLTLNDHHGQRLIVSLINFHLQGTSLFWTVIFDCHNVDRCEFLRDWIGEAADFIGKVIVGDGVVGVGWQDVDLEVVGHVDRETQAAGLLVRGSGDRQAQNVR